MQKRNASWTRVRDSQSREGGFDLAVTSHGFLAQCHAHGAHGRPTSATTEIPIFCTTHPQEIIIVQGKRKQFQIQLPKLRQSLSTADMYPSNVFSQTQQILSGIWSHCQHTCLAF